jgi:hypothetical protein
MALTNAQYTVAEGTRVRIASADNMPQDVIIHEGDNASSTKAFLGDSSVTDTTGLHIINGTSLQMTLRPGDELWCYSGQNAPVIHVIQIQKND